MANPAKAAANKPAPASPVSDKSSGFLVSSGTSMTEEEMEDIKVQIAQDLRPDLYYLEESTTAAEFYDRLSNIIIRSEYLSADQRDDLANMVRKPWTGRLNKKGRTPKEKRHFDIYQNYILPEIMGGPKFHFTTAVKVIKKEYKMNSLDAAAKALRSAREFVEGKKPIRQGKK